MTARVTTDGRFLALEGAPFRVRGVTYGTFGARLDGELYPEPWQVKQDFRAMATAGLNVVRTYTAPPRDVVDSAEDAGLRLLVGIDFEDWRAESGTGRAVNRRVADRGRRAVDEAMQALAGCGAILGISVGNEVPGDIVRLHGVESVQAVFSDLVRRVHLADENMLVTYTSYPTTEYLRVRDQDFVSCNVFLEDPSALAGYLKRLQRLSPDVPLVVTELGLAAAVHGPDVQAESLRHQLRVADEVGCAGAAVFSWTDEWSVAGEPVRGWGFGLTDIGRAPKPALGVVERWARSRIDDLRDEWPSVSVIVCAYNEERRIGECLDSLVRCRYPALEVIVCDDGSNDATASIVRGYPFRFLQLPHRGLSVARNQGLAAATGEIVAYLDADASCHPQWPYHLALSLEGEHVGATGGPNLPARHSGLVERAVAASPGGPTEVLLADDRAEHVPGCNMAFRRDLLVELGGFDPVFTAAGDDVDLCWRVLDSGRRIAFSAAAQVRHHRRDTVGGYLRQQRGYGRAERLVESRHAHRFNRLGQARWAGSIYGGGIAPRFLRPLIYHGPMGIAPFQGRVERPSDRAAAYVAPVLPLALLGACLVGLLAFVMRPALIVPAVVLALVGAYAVSVAVRSLPARDESHPFAFRCLVAFLHVAQPVARLWGRATGRAAAPGSDTTSSTWTGGREAWLLALERDLASRGCRVRTGRATDRFDLLVSVGPFVTCRLGTAVAWHWIPRYRVVFRARPGAALCAGLAIAGVVLIGPWSWLAVGLLFAAAALEAVMLRARIMRSIRLTTGGR